MSDEDKIIEELAHSMYALRMIGYLDKRMREEFETVMQSSDINIIHKAQGAYRVYLDMRDELINERDKKDKKA